MSEVSAAVLREAFDQGFAEAPRKSTAATEELLVIQAGEGIHAIRIADLAGLYADRVVTPTPSRWPELIGLAAFRGVLVPVYDLAAVLGQPAVNATRRWVALVRSTPLVALAFETVRQHVRASGALIAHRSDSGTSSPEVLQLDAGPVPVLDPGAIVAGLRQRLAAGQGRAR